MAVFRMRVGDRPPAPRSPNLRGGGGGSGDITDKERHGTCSMGLENSASLGIGSPPARMPCLASSCRARARGYAGICCTILPSSRPASWSRCTIRRGKGRLPTSRGLGVVWAAAWPECVERAQGGWDGSVSNTCQTRRQANPMCQRLVPQAAARWTRSHANHH